jgi:hypothetical protein
MKNGVSVRKIILSIFAFAFLLGYAVVNIPAEERATNNGGMSDAGQLIGMEVKNPQGEALGIIADVIEGPQERLSFAVLNYAVSDDTQMRIAVPFAALSCGEQNCILNVSRETLNSAPVFAWDDNLTSPKQAEGIYRYFGVQPYWTEKGKQR